MSESTAKRFHSQVKSKLAGRAIEGRSALCSIPQENWDAIFEKKCNGPRACLNKKFTNGDSDCRACLPDAPEDYGVRDSDFLLGPEK